MTRPIPSRRPRRLRLAVLVGTSLAIASLAGCGGGDDDDAVEIRTLSNRADLISDGDALVEIVAPDGASGSGLSVRVGTRDVTSAFAKRADGRITGLVSGLAVGDNVLVASMDGAKAAQLTITNAPRSGPVLSGAQTKPFYCATPTPTVANGNTPATPGSGLSGTPDANCNVPAEAKLYYRTTAAAQSTANPTGCSFGLPDPVWNIGATATTVPAAPTAPANGCFKPYTGGTPADIATTTTDAGVTVPFIVRVERGSINRGIYDIAVLTNPTQPWTAVSPQNTWNGKVYYTFGASTGQPRRQVRPATNWTSAEDQLKRGYLVATNSMTDSSRNSNRVMMSETVMMMKEHITDTYGPIKYTLGTGCSGGSINSNMNASINPGLLDGIVTSCTYPDSETTTLEVGDCVVLVEAYQKSQMLNLWTGLGLTQDQINTRKGAINGHPDQTACHGWYNAFGSNGRAGLFQQRLVSNNVTGAITQATTFSNNCELPNSAVYDPANPVATANLPRCNAWSWAESIWGRVAGSPAARDTRDNVGVQYGLKALRDGAITPEEFVTLNEIAGGIDRDSTPRNARTAADPEALDVAYRSGIVASGKQLAKTAIIDLRGWDDSNIAANLPPGQTPGTIPIHHQWYSWAIRDRITRDAGDAQNQALWRFARTGLAAPGTLGTDAFLSMDAWLTALKANTSNATLEQKVRAARPLSGARDTRDFCLLPEDATQSNKVYDMAACDANRFLKPSLSPRQVAGGPRAEDVLKCQLKPLVQSDYAGITFTTAQFTRLQAVFPSGVCDWSKPGVGQQVAVSPLTFKAGPGGQPLGAAPESREQ
ncbi:DUF6351 family protein [Piscinibacter koreensis]|uniref:DUF6351 domain-containing protein n=1 Tax=Piscinibacter koreensis TaxID=2742824 RepID=A0A7Y6NMC3_9BURK|nr:DUF6351 family protein [Schlegelella koreensis]NUZ05815.1 hypothetical protein [Schlegelella koreensis]